MAAIDYLDRKRPQFRQQAERFNPKAKSGVTTPNRDRDAEWRFILLVQGITENPQSRLSQRLRDTSRSSNFLQTVQELVGT